ncbi:MAG: helix-turn-helix transcriptional regulator [Pseudomonadota bacterium]
MDVRVVIGFNVRRIRQQRGWSQEEFAFKADLHRTYVSGIERGQRNPTATIIVKLADTLCVRPGVLFQAIPDSSSS